MNTIKRPTRRRNRNIRQVTFKLPVPMMEAFRARADEQSLPYVEALERAIDGWMRETEGGEGACEVTKNSRAD